MLERIDLIHNYCDRWCKRCAFTDRCSVFATEVAVAMRGDEQEALELVFGEPPSPGAPRREPSLPALPAVWSDHEECEHLEGAQNDQDQVRTIDPLDVQASEYTLLAFQWTRAHHDEWYERGDAVLQDAFDVVSWDATLTGGKVHRAVFSRTSLQEFGEEDPVQNDANGAAKVALLSLERSEAAWVLMADATGDIEAAALGRLAWALRQALSREFPAAMAFVRPGFDE
jgi:hypothetical protein